MSQDSKVSSCLKDLPQRLQTPSLKVRKNIFNDLTDLVTTTDLAENIIKGVCKVLSVTILRYQDAVSRTLVLDFVKILFSKYPSVVVKTIHATVLEVYYSKHLVFSISLSSEPWRLEEHCSNKVSGEAKFGSSGLGLCCC